MTGADAPDPESYLDLVRARDRYVAALGIEVLTAAPGRATARLTVAEQHLNFFGVGHGGMVFSLADTAFGVAANAGGRIAAMIGAHVTLTQGTLPGDLLTAEAEEVSRSRRIAVYRCTVTRLRDGREEVIATFTGTVYRTDQRLADLAGRRDPEAADAADPAAPAPDAARG